MFYNHFKKLICSLLGYILLLGSMSYTVLAVEGGTKFYPIDSSFEIFEDDIFADNVSHTHQFYDSTLQESGRDISEIFGDVSDIIRHWPEEYIAFANYLGLFQGTTSFIDIVGHWAIEYIMVAIDLGIFQGASNINFSPDAEMTRGMFVTVIGRYTGDYIQEVTFSQFSDVDPEAFYTSYIEWAANLGIVTGTGYNMFEPQGPVTREQAAVILMNLINTLGVEFSEEDNFTVFFTDESQMSPWAFDSIYQVGNLGLISGREDGSFNPQGVITRAETSAMLVRLIQRGSFPYIS